MIGHAINAAKHFLNRKEVPLLWTARVADFRAAIPIESPWHSAMLLDLVSIAEFSPEDPLVQVNLDYLAKSLNGNIVWKFMYHPSYSVPADSDDTACSLIALHRYGMRDVPYEAASSRLMRFTDENGLFLTWLSDDINNEIDVAVNANVLRWFDIMGLHLDDVERFLNDYVDNYPRLREFVRFYDSAVVVRYFIVKALANEEQNDRRQLADRVLTPLITDYLVDVVSNPLNIALTSSMLSMLQVERGANERLVELIVQSQQADGGWGAFPVVIVPTFVPGGPYFGASPALSTAFCLEALALFERGQ